MFINITDSETGNNMDSSAALIHYLEKENRMTTKESHPKELWFNGQRRDIIPQEVRVKIDNNRAKLGKNDAKFYLINISPSQKEIAHLKQHFGEQGAKEKLKDFAIYIMDEYARNFKRHGIQSNTDLLWYAKVEHNRYYSYADPEVKSGKHTEGEPKEGDQMHVQVIVSRKDITDKIKLSPMNNSRGKNAQHSAKLGQFDRKAFKQSGEILFDKAFGFNRRLEDTIAHALTMKHGTGEQKQHLYSLKQAEENRYMDRDNRSECEITKGIFQDTAKGLEELLSLDSISMGGIFDTILPTAPNYHEPEDIHPISKKKKKKGRSSGESGK
ncbi:DUF5712 family protein [Chryseobacterium gallinarum]|uniref:DUF5712 family protein n=1 Tax=Chryseobacterium gallinarum TaxID=1324352 RepID=UPI002024D2C9|nr:DUF5712 family protein [Chryseobacterium gallinarum]MCL8537642.1 DUF5712 family protein [Chryseobacterium gallinarum]